MISFWEKDYFENGCYDVVVVGGGIVGSAASVFLKKQKRNCKVLVIEKEVFGTQATTKNAGFACIGSPSELSANLAGANARHVQQLLAWKWKGIEKLLTLLGKTKTHYQHTKAYDLFDHNTRQSYHQSLNGLDELNHIAKQVTKIYPFYEPNDLALKGFGFEGFDRCLQINHEGQIHSAHTLHHLQLKSQNFDVRWLRGHSVSSYHIENECVVVNTSNDLKIKTRHLLVCNNAFAGQILPSIGVEPGRGQVLVTKPLSHFLPFKGNFHYNEGYVYFRNVGNNRLLLGGGRNLDFETENQSQLGENTLILDHLKAFLSEKILPKHQKIPVEIEQSWSGIMGFTGSGLPIVKTIEPRLHCAVGLNGMGVAMGVYVGNLAANLINK